MFKRFVDFNVYSETANRFKGSFICSLFLFFILIGGEIGVLDLKEGTAVGRAMVLAIYGYFYLGAIAILSQVKKWSTVTESIVSIVGMVGLFIFIFEMGRFGSEIRYFNILLSLFLFISFSPFLFEKERNIDFWCFNKTLWSGVSISILASLILLPGMVAALLALKYLFNINIMGSVMPYATIFCFSLLSPLYALSFVPKEYKVDETIFLQPSKPLCIITQWIMLPLVCVYFLILYAYFIKISFFTEMPQGYLAYIISGFIFFGILSYLISVPLQDKGRFVKLWTKSLFPMILIPSLFLLYAIYLRIDEYGLTEKRYLIVVFGIWSLLFAIYGVIRRIQIKHLFVSLAVLLILSSFGPWGMRGLSVQNQMSRLETKLQALNALDEEGKLKTVENFSDISEKQKTEISRLVDYLDKRVSINGEPYRLYDAKNKNDFFEKIGLEYLGKYQRQIYPDTNLFLYSDSLHYGREFIDVSGYDYYLARANVKHNSRKSLSVDFNGKKLEIILRDNVLVITQKGVEIVHVDLTKALNLNQYKQSSGRQKIDPITLIENTENGEFKFVINQLSIGKSDMSIANLGMSVFIRQNN